MLILGVEQINPMHLIWLREREMKHSMELFHDENYVPKLAPKGKSPMKNKKNADHTPTDKKKMETKDDLVDVHEAERTSEKHVESCVSSNMTPLIISDRVQRSKVLVECEGGSIDLSGDVGAVGRLIVSSNLPGDREMLLDLKGTIYRTTIVPSRTFCVDHWMDSPLVRRMRLTRCLKVIRMKVLKSKPRRNPKQNL